MNSDLPFPYYPPDYEPRRLQLLVPDNVQMVHFKDIFEFGLTDENQAELETVRKITPETKKRALEAYFATHFYRIQDAASVELIGQIPKRIPTTFADKSRQLLKTYVENVLIDAENYSFPLNDSVWTLEFMESVAVKGFSGIPERYIAPIPVAYNLAARHDWNSRGYVENDVSFAGSLTMEKVLTAYLGKVRINGEFLDYFDLIRSYIENAHHFVWKFLFLLYPNLSRVTFADPESFPNDASSVLVPGEFQEVFAYTWLIDTNQELNKLKEVKDHVLKAFNDKYRAMVDASIRDSPHPLYAYFKSHLPGFVKEEVIQNATHGVIKHEDKEDVKIKEEPVEFFAQTPPFQLKQEQEVKHDPIVDPFRIKVVEKFPWKGWYRVQKPQLLKK